jgi:beta-phosphoglucomutase family hydrolase
VLGLPDGIEACLFDLDGVLTKTAVVHFAAWKELFDAYLREEHPDEREFTQDDYDEWVDGRPREDGVRSFLESRKIELSDEETGKLAARKNEIVLQKIREEGVEAYPGSVEYLKAVRKAGLATAVVSASANCEDVVRSAGLEEYLDHRVDGKVAKERGLKGKPEPDTFLEGAREAGVQPAKAVVFEDATAGVQAGKAGDFGYVVGVDRVDHADDLRRHGADTVVEDLAELL